MKSLKTFSPTIMLLALLSAASGLWSGVIKAQDQVQVQAQVQIYGSQLMTAVERSEYQSKMRSMKTDKERDSFRLDHHEKMKVRATEKGVTLPNEPVGDGIGQKGNAGGGSRSGVGAGQGSPNNNPASGGKGPGR